MQDYRTNLAAIEAKIPNLRQRLHNYTLRFWVRIHKLDNSHIRAKPPKYKGKKRCPLPLRKATVLLKDLRAGRANKIRATGCEL
jgi:hypothetical protein